MVRLQFEVDTALTDEPAPAVRWWVRLPKEIHTGSIDPQPDSLIPTSGDLGTYALFESPANAASGKTLKLSLEKDDESGVSIRAIVELENRRMATIAVDPGLPPRLVDVRPQRPNYRAIGSYWRDLLDEESNALVAPARELMFDLESRVHESILVSPPLEDSINKIRARLRGHLDARLPGADPSQMDPIGADSLNAVIELGFEQACLYRRPVFESGFEAFSNGDLNFECDPADKKSLELYEVFDVEELCQPDGPNYFLFGEFALLWLELADAGKIQATKSARAAWLSWARLFVRCQEVFIQVYRPCPCTQPTLSKRTFDNYSPRHFRNWKQVARKDLLRLRREYSGLDLAALDARMTRNVLLAASGGKCEATLARFCDSFA